MLTVSQHLSASAWKCIPLTCYLHMCALCRDAAAADAASPHGGRGVGLAMIVEIQA